MKKMFTMVAAAALVVVAAVALAACGSSDSATATVSDPWVRVTAPKQTNSAAYMKITVSEDDVLTSASVPSSIAGRAELHETTKPMDNASSDMNSTTMNDMTGMKQVSSINVPADGGVTLAPGGFHIMIMDLAEPIMAGEKVAITLTFEKAGKVEVNAVAREG
jgi:copper(I)-binding protein